MANSKLAPSLQNPQHRVLLTKTLSRDGRRYCMLHNQLAIGARNGWPITINWTVFLDRIEAMLPSVSSLVRDGDALRNNNLWISLSVAYADGGASGLQSMSAVLARVGSKNAGL